MSATSPEVGGALAVEVGRVKRRLRFEFVKEDAWVGAFWKRRRWWGGFDEAVRADDPTKAHRRLDVYVCLLPLVPLHYTAERCPAPLRCTSHSCTASLVVRCQGCRRVVRQTAIEPRTNRCTDCILGSLGSDDTRTADQ